MLRNIQDILAIAAQIAIGAFIVVGFFKLGGFLWSFITG